MKKVKVGKIIQRLLVMLMITCVLCGDVMVANAQNTPIVSLSEEVEIENSEKVVEEAVSTESLVVEEIVEECVEEKVISEDVTAEEVAEELSDKELEKEAIEEIETIEVSETIESTEAKSGTWGNLNWSLSDGGTLTLTGSGAMQSAKEGGYPWSSSAYFIKKLVIGDYVTSISDYSFSNCINLSTVTYGSRFKDIGNYAFMNCAFTTINIPNGIKSIGNSAFQHCTSLEGNVKIPSSVTSLGTKVFCACNNIDSAEIYSSCKISDYMFVSCQSLAKVTIGNSVTGIGEQAFCNCPALTTVTLGGGITQIGTSAFNCCTALKSIYIPASVNDIGYAAFMDCAALESVTFAEGLDTISDAAFARSGIVTLKVPDSVTKIGGGAFQECNSLKTITLGCGLTTIENQTFYACKSLTKVTMSNNITSIGSSAFASCVSLTTITWPEKLTTIGLSAFYGCKELSVIMLPNSVEEIGEYAFQECRKLQSVTLGSNIKKLSNKVFLNSISLKEVKIYSTNVIYGENVFPGYTVLDDTFTIYGWADSTSEKYATDNNYKFSKFVELTSLETPAISKLVNESTGVHVYWNASTGAKTYNVYRSTTKASGYTLIKSGVTSTNYLDTTVKSGTTYYYKIVAVRDSVKSGYSSAANGITYLAAPTFKKIVNVVSGVHVYWNASTGAKTYSVYRSTNKTSGYTLVKSGLTATHYIDTTAKSGTTYYYKIIALKGSVKSAYSKPFNAITYVGTPDITARFNKGAGVQLGWNKIEGATGYAIYRKPYAGTTWTRITTIEGNKTFTWMDESVKANNGTVYKYTIRALAGSDMKTLSGCRSTGRTMARLTSRTLNSATKATATSIKCNWSTTGVCDGYEVRFMVGDTVYKTFTVGNYKTGVKTFTGLKAGQTYKIQVRSYKKVDGVGTFYSAWSTAKTVRL